MNKILAVHDQDLDVVVQPGVTREALNTYLRDRGCFFRLIPGQMPALAVWQRHALPAQTLSAMAR